MEKISEGAIGAVVARWIERITEDAPRALFQQYKRAELLLNKGLPTYLEAMEKKCESVRTLIRRDAPTPLTSIFVQPDFKHDNTRLSAEHLLDKCYREGANVVITGMAGSGKSVFLKHSFRRTIERNDTYYPIFFELRELESSDGTADSLSSALHKSVERLCQGFTIDQFRFGLRKGYLYLLLDGLDEVPIALRESIAKSICNLALQNPRCPMIVTSRPSEELSGWEGFNLAELQPFTLEQSVECIRKINFANDRKEHFIHALEDGLYHRHSEFLSNPLLTAMMLLTFDEYGEIPSKRHVFFEKCFQVLLREHDVSKGQYTRQFFSKLDYNRIEDAFMHFCALSYVERKFSFNIQELTSYVSDALASAEIAAEPHAVILDFCQSISILHKEGDYYTFAHRSFQEFFFAKFVVRDRTLPLSVKMREAAKFMPFDDTLGMIADMDQNYFDQDFLLPHVEGLNRELDSVDEQSEPSKVLGKFYDVVSIEEVKRHSEDEGPMETRLFFSSMIDDFGLRLGLNQTVLQAIELNLSGEDEVLDLEHYRYYHNDAREMLGADRLIELNSTNDSKIVSLGLDKAATQIKLALRKLEARLKAAKAIRHSIIAERFRGASPLVLRKAGETR